jgi:hypothetical protein
VSAKNPFGQRNDGGSCECSECGHTFTGLRGFDDHRITTTGSPGFDPDFDWRCSTDAQFEAGGYAPDARGRWG